MICSQLGDNTEGKRHTERTGLIGSEELLMRWRLLVESRRIVLFKRPRPSHWETIFFMTRKNWTGSTAETKSSITSKQNWWLKEHFQSHAPQTANSWGHWRASGAWTTDGIKERKTFTRKPNNIKIRNDSGLRIFDLHLAHSWRIFEITEIWCVAEENMKKNKDK